MTFMKSTAATMMLVFAISAGATVITAINANGGKTTETKIATLVSGYATSVAQGIK